MLSEHSKATDTHKYCTIACQIKTGGYKTQTIKIIILKLKLNYLLRVSKSSESFIEMERLLNISMMMMVTMIIIKITTI